MPSVTRKSMPSSTTCRPSARRRPAASMAGRVEMFVMPPTVPPPRITTGFTPVSPPPPARAGAHDRLLRYGPAPGRSTDRTNGSVGNLRDMAAITSTDSTGDRIITVECARHGIVAAVPRLFPASRG